MRSLGAVVLTGTTVAALAAAVFVPAMPQPLAYHQFADTRALLGVPNVANTASNLGFLLVGVTGMVIAAARRARFEHAFERIPYLVFFAGFVLTAFGSGYYHLQPDNERLFWDRMPMTIAFMGLIAGQLSDRFRPQLGIASLLPLLIVGAASVVYWRVTERAGVGNVVPYGVLQGYAVLAVLLFGVFQRSRYTQAGAIFQVFGWYMLAKLLEHFDRELFALGRVVSGHTLKHLAAAMAAIPVCRMLLRRERA